MNPFKKFLRNVKGSSGSLKEGSSLDGSSKEVAFMGEILDMKSRMISRTRVFTIRIPADWHERIREIAREECRTKNSVAKQAIKEFLVKRKK